MARERRNPGTALRTDWFDAIRINTPASERRAASLPGRRSLKKEWQAAWLLNAVRCIDLTTLSGDDTEDRVVRLCAKALQPIDARQLALLGASGLTTGAVCVYPTMVAAAKRALKGSAIPVASVATGFPAGLMPLDLRLAEIRYALDQGADEIDIVITRAHALQGNWSALYDELCAMREACGNALMKSILATGELKTLENVAKASHVAMQAGSDFIKTSTGKEPVNATLPVSLTMLRTIRDYRDQTGFSVGFKPAGGLRTAKDALNWQVLMLEELGRDWLRPDLFRIGASSLLGDIERQISHHVTGRYAASHRLAAG
ncbi:deoxyribose-phosphate aldolase [Paracoccus sp. MBLB3053]|uniref:Deoxyribose-phosphate aldolase n=1 Tax=Paracoccus aurantius TaxID=3073814 RepID=A0ABU2HRX6_9RHOB|nr:deoxyribose-phosphate aldolase [Paracoccus sp. MBLB3053]MDS9467522.1 deoxyribose-phosphate aldolase [Paracoccus sp. MBLB3053]